MLALGNSISRFFALTGWLSNPVKRLTSVALNVNRPCGVSRISHLCLPHPHGFLLTF